MSAARGVVMERTRDPWALESLDGTVLYDIFYESGTILKGFLLALERTAEDAGDAALVGKWGKERGEVHQERADTGAYDRDRQIMLKEKWDERVQQLVRTYPAVFNRPYATI